MKTIAALLAALVCPRRHEPTRGRRSRIIETEVRRSDGNDGVQEIILSYDDGTTSAIDALVFSADEAKILRGEKRISHTGERWGES